MNKKKFISIAKNVVNLEIKALQKLKNYINIVDPHIGYAVKNAIEDNKKVNAFKVDGKYFDCGTPEEYVDLLKEVLL